MPGYENELGMQCAESWSMNTLLRSFVISGLPAKWTVKRFETSGLSSELEKREELVLSSIGFLSNESPRKKKVLRMAAEAVADAVADAAAGAQLLQGTRGAGDA
ncbi:hypothetical protein HZH66_009655 [Vespula vulgaris]|uniref:Uncharacterized protein n=1 Tax=Vespula vulgaris TaxID=7454 RepID=A0A834N0D7_VESVU|nr:hypothetical protein HZH66_009655 [Vespula vulgaris]